MASKDLNHLLPKHGIQFDAYPRAEIMLTLVDSHESGYSSQPITQAQALALRMVREPNVERPNGLQIDHTPNKYWGTSFFPSSGGKGRGGQRRK